MRLAISNIAWPAGQDEAIAPILTEQGVQGIEIAPTKVWQKPLEASPAAIAAYRRFWERRGLRICALQALLFGRPDLTLFEDAVARCRTVACLEGMIGLAAALGAEILVFGSPKNRRVGERHPAEVDAVAVEVFRRLGEVALRHNVCFCLEPNPMAYECDFVTKAADGVDLVERVGCPGFGLHLDTGAMTLAGDPFAVTFARANGCWRHFHVSEPYLAPVLGRGIDHRPIASAARDSGYSRWVSIEMKEPARDADWTRTVSGSLAFVGNEYFQPVAS